MTGPSIVVLSLLAMPQHAVGTNLITGWLQSVGIDLDLPTYVAPRPRQGTCRDCTSREVGDNTLL